jgi:hypothetical protein
MEAIAEQSVVAVPQHQHFPDGRFWQEYSIFLQAKQENLAVEPSAPPMKDDAYCLLDWLLSDKPSKVLTPELIAHQETLWEQITGCAFSSYLAAGCCIFSTIQDIQFREHGLLKMYNQGIPLARENLMTLHARFFDEYGCRVSDFHNNRSFHHLVLSHLQSQFA